jgi:hypothetical protein
MTAGAGGTSGGGGGGPGGNVTLQAGAGTTNGTISIGTTGTSIVAIGASGNTIVQVPRLGVITTQNISFAASLALNPTNGNFIHVATMNANVTITMTNGAAGEQCTIIFLKDATASAYTVNFSGANVRFNGQSMSTTANSLGIFRLIWDDRLSTPAWVATGSTVAN